MYVEVHSMSSAAGTLADINKIIREEINKPVNIPIPTGPLDPEKIKIEVIRNHNTGKFEAVAFYMYGKNNKNRRLIKLVDEDFDDYAGADKKARWLRRQVRHGQMIVEFPGV